MDSNEHFIGDTMDVNANESFVSIATKASPENVFKTYENFFLIKDYIEEETALFEGQTFDPEQEFARILELPKGERKEALEMFKRKQAAQFVGQGLLQEAVANELTDNPDCSREELDGIYKQFQLLFGFPDTISRQAETMFDEIFKRKQRVEEIRHENNDPSTQCKKIFGFTPQGEVKVTYSPITVNIQLDHPDDFVQALYTGSHKESTTNTEEQKKTAQNISAFFCNELFESRYNNIIIGANKYATKNTYRHELQHAVNSIIDTVRKTEIRKEISDILTGFDEIKLDKSMQELKLTYYFERYKNLVSPFLKDELLAKLANHKKNKSILDSLMKTKKEHGQYDYSYPLRSAMIEIFQKHYSPETMQLMQDVMERVLRDGYKQDIITAINAFNQLEHMGFSRDATICILQAVPIGLWSKVSNRIYNSYMPAIKSRKALQKLQNTFSEKKHSHQEKNKERQEANSKLATDEQVWIIKKTLQQYLEEEKS